MRYDLLVQDALDRAQRSVVRAALQRVAAEGLPGNHHFYISFRTHFEGVEMPPSLRAQYPEEMKIVLQNQFWGLSVDDEGFSVGLYFNQVPQTLRIPFQALTSFSDPAVQFQLAFQTRPPAPGPAPIVALRPPVTPEAPKPDGNGTPKPKPTGEQGGVVNIDAFRKK